MTSRMNYPTRTIQYNVLETGYNFLIPLFCWLCKGDLVKDEKDKKEQKEMS